MGTLTLLHDNKYIPFHDCSYCATATCRADGTFSLRVDFLVSYDANTSVCLNQTVKDYRNSGLVNVQGFQYRDHNDIPLIGLASFAPWSVQMLPPRTLMQGVEAPPKEQAGLRHSKMLIVGFQVKWRDGEAGTTPLSTLFASPQDIKDLNLRLKALDAQGDAAFVDNKGNNYAGMFSAPLDQSQLGPADTGHGARIAFERGNPKVEYCFRVATGNDVQYIKERTLTNSGMEQVIVLQSVRKDLDTESYDDAVKTYEPLDSTDEQKRADNVARHRHAFKYSKAGLDHEIVSVMECDNAFRKRLEIPWPWAMSEQYSNWLDSLRYRRGEDCWQFADSPIEVFTLVKSDQWNH